MARIRTIKPDFFQSEAVARLSFLAALTWIGLWTQSDDAGKFRDSPRVIKGVLWSLRDDVTLKDVEAALDELANEARIVRYEVDGKRYLQVTNWAEHQKISKPTPSRLPNPDGTIPALPESDPGEISEDSGKSPDGLLVGKGKGKGSGNGPSKGYGDGGDAPGDDDEKPVAAKVGTRTKKKPPTTIPSDFTLTPEMRAWASENSPSVDIEFVTREFIDYWTTEGGKKVNWELTWRNRMRTKHEDMVARGWKPPKARAADPFNPGNWTA